MPIQLAQCWFPGLVVSIAKISVMEMFGCIQAERTIAIRKRKFLNKFSVIHNAFYVGYSLPLLRRNLNHVARTFS